MKALKLLREQKKENLKNHPLYFSSLNDYHKYNLEKICIFNDAIEELEDFIKESEILRAKVKKLKIKQRSSKNDRKRSDKYISRKNPKG